MSRYFLLLLWLSVILQTQRFLVVLSNQFTLHSERNKALYAGYIFLKIPATTMENCLGICLQNCLCMSFQICEGECQLCSSNKYLQPRALQERKGCTIFNFHNEVNNQQCSSTQSCTKDINCCTTSNPCLNGGTCIPSPETRFRCICANEYQGSRCDSRTRCPLGYTGKNCKQPIRSCRGYANGDRVPGEYTVLDATMFPFKVYCDFSKSSSMAWTLIQSYKRDKSGKSGFKRALFNDLPRRQDGLSWSGYRLSKSRMESIQNDSSEWRFTCGYGTDGLVYIDYVRGLKYALNILTWDGAGCIDVGYVNIRGQECTNCTVFMVQGNRTTVHVHHRKPTSNAQCAFKPTELASCTKEGGPGEDSFGFYHCINTEHRCVSSAEATTQTWLGGEN